MSEQGKILKQANGFYLEDIEGEHLLFRPTSSKALFLNETASLIWKLCDGSRTGDDIAQMLSESYQESSPQVAEDVRAAIDKLASDGALLVTA